MPVERPRRGRPKIHDDEEILDSALRVFATHGYEGMSMRSLNSELGLSHATVNQRFGTKERLYREAVDHGFAALLDDMRAIIGGDPLPADPLEELRIRFRAFLLASARRPHLNRLINNEGVRPSKVLDRIFRSYIQPAMRPARALIDRLAADGLLEPVGDREVLFLLANGAGSAYSLPALAGKFDRAEGRIDPEAYADAMATLLVNALRRPPSPRRRSRAR